MVSKNRQTNYITVIAKERSNQHSVQHQSYDHEIRLMVKEVLDFFYFSAFVIINYRKNCSKKWNSSRVHDNIKHIYYLSLQRRLMFLFVFNLVENAFLLKKLQKKTNP